jgi:hypothetical protein
MAYKKAYLTTQNRVKGKGQKYRALFWMKNKTLLFGATSL